MSLYFTTAFMRKTLLFLTFSAGLSSAFGQTQIGNSDFEQWETTTSEIAEPVNWNSFKTASGSWNSFGGQQMNRTTAVRPGSTGQYAVRIWARNAGFGVVAQGNMTLGRIEMGSTTASSTSNYNYSSTGSTLYSEPMTDSPDSIVFWAKFKPINTAHTARASIIIHNNTNNYKDPNDVGGANTIATAILNFGYNAGNWQRIAIPFTYSGTPSNASYILATYATNNIPGGGTVNDSLYIDDIQLVYVPKAAFTAFNTVCAGTPLAFTNTSTNFPTSYSWNFGDGSPADNSANPTHTYAAAGSYQVTLTATNQWGSTTTAAYTVTVNATDNATFGYASNTMCLSGGNQTPTVASAGNFSATPAGLNFVSTTTGEINVAASNAGTYDVTYTTTGTCPATSTVSITITSAPDASFTYSNTSFCQSENDPSPVFGVGASAGSFASTAGLVLGNTNGIIDLSASTPGNYTITNAIAASGSCPSASATFSITINANPTVALGTFNDVCTYTPTFALTGGTPAGGTYSGSGVTAGNFDPSSASANSTVTITYNYTDGNGCSNMATNTIFVSECLGVEDLTSALVNVYPNPTTGILHVTNISGKTTVEVINALGTVVQKRVITTSDNTLDISSLNAGVYFVRVENQLFRIIKK